MQCNINLVLFNWCLPVQVHEQRYINKHVIGHGKGLSWRCPVGTSLSYILSMLVLYKNGIALCLLHFDKLNTCNFDIHGTMDI